MARKFKVEAEITAKDKASAPTKRAESGFAKMGKTLGTAVKAGALAAAAAIVALTAALVKAVAAAGKQEDAIAKLDAALVSLGAESRAVSQDLQNQATALQKITRAGDETIIAGQALIASFTKNTDEIKAGTVAALDLSAATGTDLKAAFLLLGRAAAGETSTLSRYGITLDENIPKSEKFAAAVKAINAQFGGQAQQAAKTFTGRMAQFGNALGDVVEGFGAFVTNSTLVRSSIEALTAVLGELAKALPQVETPLSRLDQLQKDLIDSTEALRLAEFAINDQRTGGLRKQRLLADLYFETGIAVDILEGKENALGAAREKVAEITADIFREEQRLELIRRKALTTDDKLAKAAEKLGVVLEATLRKAFKETATALETLRLGMEDGVVTSDRYNEAVRIAATEQEKIQDAFDRSGGDLAIFKSILEATTETTETFALATDRSASSVDRVRVSTAAARIEIERIGVSAVTTTAAFDRLAEAQSRSVAVSAAIAGGGRLTLGGTRIRLPGGGSRLTSTPGLGGGRPFSLGNRIRS